MTKRQTYAKTLAELPIGSADIIYDINEKGALLRRLMDLGFSCGTAVEKTGISPLGDPCAYKILGTVIALRRQDACKILLTEDENGTDRQLYGKKLNE
ncbi:feoA family protein [Candidatus Apopatosoma intestinale]|nr:feoA family protein [Candidatus Apopatosoma intestinale]